MRRSKTKWNEVAFRRDLAKLMQKYGVLTITSAPSIEHDSVVVLHQDRLSKVAASFSSFTSDGLLMGNAKGWVNGDVG